VPGGIAAHFNNIVDNTEYGVINEDPDSSVFDAENNWWGAASGPYHPTSNPDGEGNAVSDYVDFMPWSTAEFPTVTTRPATDITDKSAKLNMEYTMGNYASVKVRFLYRKSTDTDKEWSETFWAPRPASGNYSQTVPTLTPGTKYDFKAQLKYYDIALGEKLIEGAKLQFTTLAYPTVTTQHASEVSKDSATLNMGYTVGDYSPVKVRFAHKTYAGSTWTETAWVSETASGTYAETVSGLSAGVVYVFKAQLKYDSTVIEGTTLQFKTPSPCFIATAAYGTPTAEQLDVLREFRDVVLLNSTLGTKFVELYYRTSPPIADFIARHEAVRTLVREVLIDPIVWVVDATGDMWQN
jgi:hypothetical protein